MRFVTQNEIEYLGSNGGEVANPELVNEMCRRLNALRQFDQNFSKNDWQPHAHDGISPASARLRLA